MHFPLLCPLRKFRLSLPAAALFLAASISQAQVVLVPKTPQVGSSNPATADPLVPRPRTKPCVVPLFTNLKFADFNPKSFSYTPPAACPGPWSKVVFTADFTVTAGRQFDRTAAFYLGHANIYYGTTAEPRAVLSPSWHVESDVTDLSAIFKTSQTGEANLGNFVGESGGVDYTGIIYGNAALEFYPETRHDPAPHVADIVVPVNGPGGDAGTLNTTFDQITQTLNLPTNVERVYLDVIAQSQSGDEFWYTCVTDAEAATLESCNNTSFRETEITIDGTPAGVAPVYPWIYTGGIDPYLWEPIPGIQTLNFKPYRVDLTPFAGVLSDGNAHTVGVSVYNANSYFLATANLLVFTDPWSKSTAGAVTKNTLAAPSPVVTDNITVDSSGNVGGNLLITSERDFTISGFINTSHGRVDTTVHQSVGFSNNQSFVINATTYQQNIQQLTTVHANTTRKIGWFSESSEQNLQYPLSLVYTYAVNADGSAYQTVTSDQKDLATRRASIFGVNVFNSKLADEQHTTDTYRWDSSGNALGPSATASWQTYVFKDSLGQCWSRTITSASLKLTSVEDGKACH